MRTIDSNNAIIQNSRPNDKKKERHQVFNDNFFNYLNSVNLFIPYGRSRRTGNRGKCGFDRFRGTADSSLRNRILARAQARCGASVKIKIGDWGELELAVLAHVVIGGGSPFNRSET